MDNIKQFNFLKAVNIYMRILNAESYIESCHTLEKSENKKVLDFICEWLELLKNDVHVKILSSYYNHPEHINVYDIGNISKILNTEYESLEVIFNNMKYVPIQPPFFTLKTMVDEISSSIPDEMGISNIYFKNITEFNFTESKMMEPIEYYTEGKEVISKKIGSVPNIFSMTVIYHNNPLMWPLIFHEYGHTVFKKVKKTAPYERIFTKIRVFCSEKDISIDSTKLSTLMSEVFSDLFAINHYSSNYFFAFYFHEILSSNINQLLNLSKDGIFEIKTHPPSAIRYSYMLKELEKKGYSNNKALKKLLDYHHPYAEKITDNMGKIESKFIEFYELIFNCLSELFDDIKIEIDTDLINKLHRNLEKKLPIGTSLDKNSDMKKLLESSKGEFDIESNNRTLDMIYTGWEYLILDMISKLYDEPDYDKYLGYSELDHDEIKEKAFDNKMLKFDKEYDFLTKNISYSIETSMIVSNY